MKIAVTFIDGTRVEYDADKVSFRDHDGTHFDFVDDGNSNGCPTYAEIISDGKSMVNWDNVKHVRSVTDALGRRIP